MARATINKTTLLGSYPTLQPTADSADVSMQASSGASGSNGNQIAFGDFRALVVLVRNSHGSTAYTVTFTSVADAFNRTGDITAYNLAAGDIAAFYFERSGWRQSDGNLYLEANNAAVLFGAIGIN